MLSRVRESSGFDITSFVYRGHMKELANNLLRTFRILRKRIIFA